MLPRLILHNAVSLDGRMDWFSPDIGLYYSLISRWKEDATLVGSGTLLSAAAEAPPEDASAFDPPTYVENDTRPLLVVPDSRGQIRTWHYLRQQPYWRDALVLCSESTPHAYLHYLEQRHIRTLIIGREHVDLRAALETLHSRHGIKVVRVDSGGTLNGVLLRAGLVNEISLLVHPSLVGGVSPRSFFRAEDLTGTEGVIKLKLLGVEQLQGEVVWLRYEVLPMTS